MMRRLLPCFPTMMMIIETVKKFRPSVHRITSFGRYGAYFCFCFFTGDEFFIGATPERQLTVTRAGRLISQHSRAWKARNR